MRTLESKFADYLEFLAGEPPLLAQLADVRTDGLPLSLKERYRFFGVTLFDLDWILAMELPDVEICSPREYARHVGMLKAKLRGKRVIFVMSAMPSSSRNRLIQAGLPFVVPGRQMFLPPFALELRRRTMCPKIGSSKKTVGKMSRFDASCAPQSSR